MLDPTMIVFMHQLQHAMILVMVPDKSLYFWDCYPLSTFRLPVPAVA
jgi:hypothetical protein